MAVKEVVVLPQVWAASEGFLPGPPGEVADPPASASAGGKAAPDVAVKSSMAP